VEIRAANLCYSYGGHRVLHDLTWHVRQGVTGLLGPSGAGKTTLLSLLVTINRPRTGRILVGENDLGTAAGRQAARKVIGYLPQHFSLVRGMRVRDTVAYAAWLNGVPYTWSFRAAGDALVQVGLTDQEHCRVHNLSPGMRQRLGIASALAHEPAVLVLDDPTGGLEASRRRQLRETVHEISRDRTVVLSTQRVENVAHLCDDIAILDEGRMRFSGSSRELTSLVECTAEDAGSQVERAYDHFLTCGRPDG